jgi:hypothetical protein
VSDDTPEPKREPAWLGNLARTGATAQAQEQRRKQRLGSSGPANEGRRLALWGCDCGWQGSARELKPGAGGLACPACGATGDLKAR